MPQPRRGARRTRRHDPAVLGAALLAQAQALRDAVAALCAHPRAEDLLGAPAGPGAGTVRDLAAHLCTVLESSRDRLETAAGEPLTAVRWVRRRDAAETAAAGGTRERAAALAPGPEPVAAAVHAAVAALAAVLDGAGTTRAAQTAPAPALRTVRPSPPPAPHPGSERLLVLLLETVVHGDELADAAVRAARTLRIGPPDLRGTAPGAPGTGAAGAAPSGAGFPHDRQALAAVVRLLADTLAEAAPGGSVELRIPPFAAVQCVAGPRHTRGTPPNVVETDSLTWIRLATGRLSWADALAGALLTASGDRSDISGLLPVTGADAGAGRPVG